MTGIWEYPYIQAGRTPPGCHQGHFSFLKQLRYLLVSRWLIAVRETGKTRVLFSGLSTETDREEGCWMSAESAAHSAKDSSQIVLE
jgi:hypothetical protein